MSMPSPTRILALYNQKGGIAKTTTSVNLALCLAAAGRGVLMVDLDAQANATRSLCVDGTPAKSLQDLLGEGGTLAEAILPTPFEGLSVLPSSPSLAGIETRIGAELRSQRSLAELFYNSEVPFDYVLLDCPPAFGLLSANALVAASSVLIPASPTAFAFDGLQRTWDVIQKIQGGLNKTLAIDGILLTMMEQDPISRQYASMFRKEYKGYVLETTIQRDREIAKAGALRLPVAAFNPQAVSTQAYITVAYDLLRRHQQPLGSETPEGFRDLVTAKLGEWSSAVPSSRGDAEGVTRGAVDGEVESGNGQGRGRAVVTHLLAAAVGLVAGAWLAGHVDWSKLLG